MMIPRDLSPQINAVFNSDHAELKKLSAAFFLIANFQIAQSKNECEIYRALGDTQSLVKEQIKNSTISHMLNIYADCYQQATGSALELEDFDE